MSVEVPGQEPEPPHAHEVTPLEFDESIPPRPEEEIADALRAAPDERRT